MVGHMSSWGERGDRALTGSDECLPGWGLTETGGDNVAEIELLDQGGIDACLVNGTLEGDGAELWGRDRGQGALKGANGCPGHAHNDHIVELGCLRGEGAALRWKIVRKE